MKRIVAILSVFVFFYSTATAQSLTGRSLENLEAFAHLLGYVQYFHPSDQAAGANWEAFAVQNIASVEGAKNARELAVTLENLFRPYAPTLRVYPRGAMPPLSQALKQSGAAKEVVMWAYVPLGSGEKGLLAPGKRLRAPLEAGKVPEGVPYSGGEGIGRLPQPIELTVPKPDRPLVVNLGAGVTASLPLVLYADKNGTLPYAEVPAPPVLTRPPGAGDRGTRLAAVALTWNVFQHFFSYWDTVATDWQASLAAALQEAAVDETGQDFLATLERLTDGLEDGHTRTTHLVYSDFGNYSAPFTVDRVEGQLIVTTVPPDNPTRIRPGDALLELDGQSAEAALRTMLKRVPGVGQWGRYVALSRLLSNDTGRPIEVGLSPVAGGRPYTLDVAVEQGNATALRENRPPVVAQLAPGILYVDLTRIEKEQSKNVIERLEKAKGIIFDMRGYPNQVAFDLLAHISQKPLKTAPFLIPVVTRPDHKATRFIDITPTWAEPQAPQLTDNLAFIINGNGAISYAESIMGLLERYGIGARVGEHTAGANGDVVSLELPGDYATRWTGLKVTKLVGKPLFTVGVTPSVPVERTRAGVAAGRDELLERAFKEVAKRPASAMKPRAINLPPPAPATLTPVPVDVEGGGRSVAPSEWSKAGPGIFLRQATLSDFTALLLRTSPGTSEATLEAFRKEFGLKPTELVPAGKLQIKELTWQLAELRSEEDTGLRATVASTRASGKTFLVLIQGNLGEYDKLYQKVFLPALRGFGAGE